MTSPSGQVLKSIQPGGLNDMLGIRLGGILMTDNGGCMDEIELRGATAHRSVMWHGRNLPLVTENKFGNGRAIYVGVDATNGELSSIIEKYVDESGARRGPRLPQHISGRLVDDRHMLLLNHSGDNIDIPIKGTAQYPDRQYLPRQGNAER